MQTRMRPGLSRAYVIVSDGRRSAGKRPVTNEYPHPTCDDGIEDDSTRGGARMQRRVRVGTTNEIPAGVSNDSLLTFFRPENDPPPRFGTATATPSEMDEAENDGLSSEQKMRHAFEARRGAPFSDEEWEEAKRNLVGIFLMMGTRDVSPDEENPQE